METTSFLIIPEGYEVHSKNNTVELILFQDLGFALGLIGSLINIPLLVILFSSFAYLVENKLMACLAIGDCLNCLGIMLQGLQRGNIFRRALADHIVPIQTYWTCAWMAFDLIGLFGSLIPAVATLCMAIERILASHFILIYRTKFSLISTLLTFFCTFYTIIAVLIAFFLSFLHRDEGVKFWCGRKVSYTYNYMRFCYFSNVFCYFLCFLATTFCLIKVRRMLKKSSGNQENKDNLLRIKSLFIIVVISTITVALPSLISLTSSFLVGIIDVAISDASDWMLVFKSSMNLFVYFFLNQEFRKRATCTFKIVQNVLIAKYVTRTSKISVAKISVTQRTNEGKVKAQV